MYLKQPATGVPPSWGPRCECIHSSYTSEMTFKDKLDQAAKEARTPVDNSGRDNQPSLLERVIDYVPTAAKIGGGGNQENSDISSRKHLPGPPHRPDHDGNVEDFMRDQHGSKKQDGTST
ncbi:hypothetical protein F5X99DRAFT_393277 [Biscogniauxia marginata]|nr:hypothetical protein F5X99DRAFT_393277 [Biscogniauxia marginata]